MDTIKKKIINLKNDYNKRTYILTSLNIIISFLYASYNEMIGIMYNLIWNECIGIYYFLLVIIRIILIYGKNHKNQNRIILISYLFFLIISVAMLPPIILMINNQRKYNLGLIPAIAMAAYTTFSITMAIINVKKTKNSKEVLVKQIRLINLISSLLSILVLQNTIILANGGYDENMTILSIYTSIGIIFIIIFVIIFSFKKFLSNYRE